MDEKHGATSRKYISADACLYDPDPPHWDEFVHSDSPHCRLIVLGIRGGQIVLMLLFVPFEFWLFRKGLVVDYWGKGWVGFGRGSAML